jgi:methionyl-tRNA formyltransferase
VRRDDAIIDWSLPAVEVWRRVRAYNPWPVATTFVDGEPLRILEAWPVDEEPDVEPGVVVDYPVLKYPNGVEIRRGTFGVRCGRGLVAVRQAQRSGKRAMSGGELLRGWRELLGKRLGGE